MTGGDVGLGLGLIRCPAASSTFVLLYYLITVRQLACLSPVLQYSQTLRRQMHCPHRMHIQVQALYENTVYNYYYV
ncbi:hypothetical protein GGR57DRAFT_253187 [Xylariaceae sp. FL1272]|nr:hypothetical protein GGR57DRAFT_253187 [Xylariaceae sp. FL1272]